MVKPITLAKRYREHPNGTFRGRDGLEAMKDGKMCAVRGPIVTSSSNGMGDKNTKIVVFPLNEEHRKSFEQAAQGVRHFGPAADNPGAVGTVSLRRVDGTGPYVIKYAQAHYKTSENEGSREGYIPRSLATRYAGWRQRAFRFATQMAREDGCELIFDHKAFRSSPEQLEKTQMFKDLRKVCEEDGLELSHTSTSPVVIKAKK